MAALPFSRLNAFLLGKTASYRCNAYDDAEIARQIINYVRTRQMPDGPLPTSQRAANLIAQTPTDRRDERLVVQAFTMFRLNGYADLMLARFIEQHARLERLITHTAYEDRETGPVDLWFWLPPLLKKDVGLIQEYAREAVGIELTLHFGEIMREVVRVQEANIDANHDTCHLLKCQEPTGHPKVDALWDLANDAAHPRIFMVSAARTQTAAANWDRLVILMLRRYCAADSLGRQ